VITAILLILLGLGLVAVEVYVVPGLNVVGIAGGLSIVAGVVVAFVEAGPAGGIIATLGALAVGGSLFYVMWQTGGIQKFILSDMLSRNVDQDRRESDMRSKYLGQEGIAVTPLRPAGVVEIDGDRIEVQTEGGFIASGSAVRIVAMDRRRFFVRLADAEADGSAGGPSGAVSG
jgi:membrane-bound ClpP family serine protease